MLPVLDIIFIIIVVIVVIRCIMRGFVEEFLSMAALIFGIAGAVFLSGPVAKLLDKYFKLSMWSHIIAFLGCFIVIYIIIKILEGIIHNIFDKLNLEKLDKVLGFVLGLFEGFLVVAVLVFLLSWFKWVPFINMEQLLKNSFIAQFIQPLLVPIIKTQAMIYHVLPV
jgi:membrane protein required for colicin V production